MRTPSDQLLVVLRVCLVLLTWLSPATARTLTTLYDATAEDLAAGLESGDFTSVDLVNAYNARILEVNPGLHVVTELNPDALSIARALDAERAQGTTRGPLHGLPLLIKNNIATKDQMNNTAGSYALLGAKVPRDATVAKKLRQAGVVILGKANLSQWANFRSSNSSNGWSAYGGQVYGAYYPKQDPSGSSSGSGVGPSIGLALAALGTETSGSILSPAHRNNLVGIKPSVGLTSRSLVIPISEHQDTVGPMAVTVKDAAYILTAIAGPDPHDNYTSAIPHGGAVPDYVAACDFSALRGARIGIPENVLEGYGQAGGPEVTAFRAAIEILRDAGATIVPDANLTRFAEYRRSGAGSKVLYADFLADLRAYLAQLTVNPRGITNLRELRAFTEDFPLERYPTRDVAVWDTTLEQGWDNTDPRFWKAYQKVLRLGTEGGVLGAIRRDDLDALVLPTSFAPGLAAGVGSPVITVPLGFYPADAEVKMNSRGNLVATGPNVPFGISFLGDRFAEATLVGLAYAFEQRTMARQMRRPYIVPNIELADVM